MLSSCRRFLFRVTERQQPLSSAASNNNPHRARRHQHGSLKATVMRNDQRSAAAAQRHHPPRGGSSAPVGQSFRMKGSARVSADDGGGGSAASASSTASAQRLFESKWRGAVDNSDSFERRLSGDDPLSAGISSSSASVKTENTHARLSRDDALAAIADRDRRAHAAEAKIASPRSFSRLSPYMEPEGGAAATAAPRSRAEAVQQMRQTLLDDDADWLSTVEITTGDETDEELKQLNAMSKRHTAVSGRSALAKNVLLRNVSHNKRRRKDDEESPEDSLFSSETRTRFSTWDAIDTSDAHVQRVLDDVAARSLTDREWDRSEGHYRHTFDASVTLEHQRDAVQHTNSIYSNRALALPDFWAYHAFVTPLEEKRMVAELMRLLLKPVAAFHAQEGRYCVNLYEKRLGTLAVAVDAANVAIGMNERAPVATATSSSSTAADHCLAFSIQHDAPTLYAVLQRAARTELIPAMPNVVQVSEMVSAFAGYAPHLKHPSIGSYFGILNLVSSAQLGFVHRDMPWSPKAMLLPRAMYVFGPELLRNYRVGYQHLDREWETHQDRSRFTKDYRIEIMFATVDAETVPRLQGAVRATDAAERKSAAARGESRDALVVPPTSSSS